MEEKNFFFFFFFVGSLVSLILGKGNIELFLICAKLKLKEHYFICEASSHEKNPCITLSVHPVCYFKLIGMFHKGTLLEIERNVA